jgi:hypothetical protein
MRNARKSSSVNATVCPTQITITVTPDARRGRYCAYLDETEQEHLCTSRQPVLDSARKLIARGHDPRTMLIMRWQGANDWALRGPLGVAAKLTVDEHNGSFAKWKPLSRSAVPSQIAKSTDPVALMPAPLQSGRVGPRPKKESNLLSLDSFTEDQLMYDEFNPEVSGNAPTSEGETACTPANEA